MNDNFKLAVIIYQLNLSVIKYIKFNIILNYSNHIKIYKNTIKYNKIPWPMWNNNYAYILRHSNKKKRFIMEIIIQTNYNECEACRSHIVIALMTP